MEVSSASLALGARGIAESGPLDRARTSLKEHVPADRRQTGAWVIEEKGLGNRGGYGIELIRAGVRLKCASNLRLKIKSVNRGMLGLAKSSGFGPRAEKGTLLATIRTAPDCIATNPTNADLGVEESQLALESPSDATCLSNAVKPLRRRSPAFTKRGAQGGGDRLRQAPADSMPGHAQATILANTTANGVDPFQAEEMVSSPTPQVDSKDMKLTIKRVLEALAQRVTEQSEAKDKASKSLGVVDDQREKTLQGALAKVATQGGRVEKSRGTIAERGGSYLEWGGSLAREVPLQRLLAYGSPWQRDLGVANLRSHQATAKKPDIVQQVLVALSSMRSSTGVARTMAEFVGKVTMADLKQVLTELGLQKEWLTALQVFDWMHGVTGLKPDEPIYHTMIILLGNARRMDVAEALFEGMMKEGMYPGQYEYAAMVSAYIRSGNLHRGIAMLERMREVGVRPSVTAYNVLIDGCTKASKGWEIAAALLEQMRRDDVNPDRVTYTTLILVYSRKSRHKEAVQIFEEMYQRGCMPDKATYIVVLNAYSKLGKSHYWREPLTKVVLFPLVPGGLWPQGYDKRRLMGTFFGGPGDVNGMLDAHRHMAEQGVEQDAVSFNLVLNSLSRVGRTRDVGRYHALMRKARVAPDLTTCSILINAFGRAREWGEVDLVLLEMERLGLQPDITVYNSLLSVYGKAGLFPEVELIVKTLRSEGTRPGHGGLAFDLVTYNTLLDVYGKAGRVSDVTNWFSEMKKADVQPDVKTFNALVNAYGRAYHFDGDPQPHVSTPLIKAEQEKVNLTKYHTSVKEVLELFHQNGNKPDLVFYNTLLFMFGRGGQYEDAWQVLEEMKQAGYAPTIETYNSLILVFGRGSVQEALKIFADMVDSNVQPNSTTLKLLMDTHAKKGLVDECLKVYRESSKFLGEEIDETLLSSAFAACCNMHCIEEAEKLLIETEARGVAISLACYNWLILGYGRKGQWKEAEKVLERMKAKKIIPNAQSFSFLLEGYSLCRQHAKGEALVSKLHLENLVVGTGGYNALLRLYIRMSDLKSAFEVYDTLQHRSLKPNQSTFSILIEACAQEGSVNKKLWGLIEDLENADFSPKYGIYSALLVVLARCGKGPEAGKLVDTLQRLGCSMDVCNLLREENVALSDQEDECRWQNLGALFTLMEREGLNLELERIFHNALLDALWSVGCETRALKVAELSVAQGVFGLEVCLWNEDVWSLDLRFASSGAAQVLLLTWLAGIRRAMICGEDIPTQLKILQAWDWQMRIRENLGAREAVSAHLTDLGAPFVLIKDGLELEAPGCKVREWLAREVTGEGLILSNSMLK